MSQTEEELAENRHKFKIALGNVLVFPFFIAFLPIIICMKFFMWMFVDRGWSLYMLMSTTGLLIGIAMMFPYYTFIILPIFGIKSF